MAAPSACLEEGVGDRPLPPTQPAPLMLSLLFWNLGDNPLTDRVARLASHLQADIVILAEGQQAASAGIEQRLCQQTGSIYHAPPSAGGKILIYTNLPEGTVTERFGDQVNGRITIRLVKRPKGQSFLLAAVHLPSKASRSPGGQTVWSPEYANMIRTTEGARWENKTVVVGDFNMNPFDEGMVAANGFHGVMTRDLARKGQRTVDGRPSRYFYNPMWGFFGDRHPDHPGTFYRSAGDPISYFWHLYDQVLVRPGLMDHLSKVEILTDDGTDSLLTSNGLPDKEQASDHLPLFLQLDL